MASDATKNPRYTASHIAFSHSEGGRSLFTDNL